MKLGFVGAGRMGRPMISRLVAAGHEVVCLVRSEAAHAAVAAVGAVPVLEPAAAAAGADALLLCLLTDQQVRTVCLDAGMIDLMPSGSLLVVHTTGSPGTVAALAERAAPRGIDVVDAPVASGGPTDVESGHAALHVGADAPGLMKALPILRLYGDPIVHCGGPGSGQQVKLISNAIFAANIGIVAEAVRVAAELGLEEKTVLDAVQQGSGASRALMRVAATGSVSRFAALVGEFIGKDVAVINQVVAELGVDLGVMRPAHGLLEELLPVEYRGPSLGRPQSSPH